MTTAPGPAAATPEHGWGGRLPLLAPDDLDEPQQNMYDYLQAGALPWTRACGFQSSTDTGRLIGPFNAFLHSPKISLSYNELVGAERTFTTLTPDVREVVILTVGVEWASDYEVYAHVAAARAEGVGDAVVAAVRAGTTSADFTLEQAGAHAFTKTLVRRRAVDDQTYRRAVDLFGARRHRHGPPDRPVPDHLRPAEHLPSAGAHPGRLILRHPRVLWGRPAARTTSASRRRDDTPHTAHGPSDEARSPRQPRPRHRRPRPRDRHVHAGGPGPRGP